MSAQAPLTRISTRTGSGAAGNVVAREGDWNASGARARPPEVATTVGGTTAVPAPESPSGARAMLPVLVASGTTENAARIAAQPVWFAVVLKVPVTDWVPVGCPVRQ